MKARAFLILAALLPLACNREVPPPPALTAQQRATMKELSFHSAREGDVPTLRECLAAGQDVNEPNARGDTLLTVAAYNGQAEAVEALLARQGVRIDAKNKMGLTALAAAAFKGNDGIARSLLKAGADVNAASPAGQTALMFAALAGKAGTVQLLLAAGAKPAMADEKGNTALSLALGQGSEEVVKVLEGR